MSILKNYWLRASAAILTLVLGIGLFVNGMEKESKNKEISSKVVTQKVWFDVAKISSSGGDTPSNYRIVQVSTSTPPEPADLGACAQQNTSGQFCAYQLEFDADIDSEELEDVIDLDVQSAMASLSATASGHARNPSNP
ncbi:hypothetical protein [Sphingobacterium corticibacterium]|uniref:Uncharacterized protein n=1 Tax=Sphingobacterium corticibacterium TaxID=2484746 RepID=A0A4Q6XI97_9SPHI|nr:hypothetical protein [Sphingobacterium corticibacterium]RZF58925.1 hypothetical protein EWE74_16530 [Sphingobacterium corticibacterium]